MEWMGYLCFAVLLMYSSYPGRVRAVERKCRKLQRRLRKLGVEQEGEETMSKIIEKLVGRECKLVIDAEKNILEDDQVDATILEVDEEWVRFTYLDKKKNIKTKIIRIDAIESIEELEE